MDAKQQDKGCFVADGTEIQEKDAGMSKEMCGLRDNIKKDLTGFEEQLKKWHRKPDESRQEMKTEQLSLADALKEKVALMKRKETKEDKENALSMELMRKRLSDIKKDIEDFEGARIGDEIKEDLRTYTMKH